jgi:tetratricopeptide (TPR) repeat protein
MSHTPTLQPPELLTETPSHAPPPLFAEPPLAVQEMTQRVRVELAATTDRSRQARLLMEVANLEERAGDEPAAARDYLAAYNADQSLREPLEGLVRLLEKRRSLKNLGKLVDALVRVATAPDEKVRGLLLRAAYQADVAGDLAEAKRNALEASTIDGAPTAEQASAWLALEVLAGRTGDPTTREAALAERTKFATQPEWRALLLLDRARMAAAAAQPDAAASLIEEARSLGSTVTWAATALLEQVTREAPGTPAGDSVPAGAEPHADALDETAALVEQATLDGALGDALGVPQWARQPARLIDAWLRAAEARRQLGQVDRAAATLDHALAHLGAIEGDEARLAEGAVVNARIRLAEQTGDTALAAQLAEKRLTTERDGGLAAALAMRVAEQAASQGDATRAFEALSRAIGSDPGCLPARALQLDMLSGGADPAAFAAQLESFAEHLATDEARGRAFLLAAYVWAASAKDVGGAKAALSQAAMYGVPPSTTARIARALASISDDVGWYEEATKRLLAAGSDDGEVVSLYVELVRLRHARGDAEGEAKALREMAAAPKGGWLARVLEAFFPAAAGDSDAPGAKSSALALRARAAVEELAAMEKDPDLARGLALVAAMRALAAGDGAAARRQLRELADRDPSDALVASMLTDLDRAAGDHAAAARVASATAAATGDAELASALELEAAFERWRDGDRPGALQQLEAASVRAPDAATMALSWAARGVGVDSLDARRSAIERAAANPEADLQVLALERFATEIGGGDPDAAAAALAVIERAPEGSVGVAAALARLVWSLGAADTSAAREATARIAARGPQALALASAEQVRLAREGGDHDELAHAASRWFDAGGALPAALEWLAAAMALREPREEIRARMAVAATLPDEAREAMLASAALVQSLVEPDVPAPFIVGQSAAARLSNLEVSPPGCDPRRRATALAELNGVLGEDAGDDAISLAGWSALAAADVDGAHGYFEKATSARPSDIASWEGLRSCAQLASNKPLCARAAAELGARCLDAARGGAFWEEAALLWLELGDEANIDRALEESFARDARRAVAFDKLFRRVRARKDNDKLLALISRRLEVADDPQEIKKLFWEQARVLREKGDQDAALKSLEHVTMLDPDHVGALALLGEINIRRGHFEDAAESLARLAMLDTAPAKSRVTAGVAAVDLYENKLERYDKALEVLLSLHQAKISTLPVRERLARAAARTGAWNEATSMLEELMNERTDAQGRIEAARLAMTIHRDRLGRPQGAAAAIEKLLQEAPADGEALDMLLQTEHPRIARDRLLENARRALVESLQREPTEVTSVRRLANVARALSDDALHQAALGVLASLGAADARTEQTLVHFATKKSRPPQIAISPSMLRSLLAPGDEGPVGDLFVLLGPTLVEALGPTLQGYGVGRRDKVDPRSGLALRNEIAAWAGAFGVREFDLYVGGSDPGGVQGIAGDPPSLVVGSSINAPIASMARARVARELLSIVRGTSVARLRDDMTIAAIVVAACKLAEVPMEHPPYAVLAEVERLLGKAIARRTRKLLPDLCRAIVSRAPDVRGWTRQALASQDRVGAIASGDPSVVLMDVLGASASNLGQAVVGNARAEELLRFVLSPQYLELRRSLGLDGGDAP